MKKRNCVSTTGCVHAIRHTSDNSVTTLCNHCNYYAGYFGYEHEWSLTDKPVTCKRCLAMMNNKKYSDKEILDFIQNIVDKGDDFVLDAQAEELPEDDADDAMELSAFTFETQWVYADGDNVRNLLIKIMEEYRKE